MKKVIDVAKIALRLEKKLSARAAIAKPGVLLSVQAGKAPDSETYIKSQEKVAKKLGIEFCLCRLPKNAPQKKLVWEIKKFNSDTSVAGIIVNRPFPKNWNPEEIFSLIDVKKDVEGVTFNNLGRLFYGKPCLISPTALAVLAIIDFLKIDLYGKNITVVGFSSLIGRPLALLLGQRFATVSITHIATYQQKKLPFYINNSDIVISAVGKPGLIKGEWIKAKSLVIDVGIAKKGSKITGDLDFEGALKKAAWVTPVPGGVGKLTTLFLFKNLLEKKLKK